MKNNKLIYAISAFIIVIALAVFIAYGYYLKSTYTYTKPIVSMEIEGYGTVKIELYPDMAPNTVRNFIKLANEGYYNGLNFHRVEDNLIQGGEKETDGLEENSICINGEFSENGYDNTLKFERGILGLARADYTAYASGDAEVVKAGYNSGYAQFFIMTEKEESFDGLYTAFGKVIEGMDIVDKISKLETVVDTDEETGETTETSTPVNPPIIKSMSVETFGVKYSEPKTHEAFDINSYILQKFYGISY